MNMAQVFPAHELPFPRPRLCVRSGVEKLSFAHQLRFDRRWLRAAVYYMNALTVRLPDELRADLLEISSRQSAPVSDLVRESIRRYVAIERFRAIRNRTLPFAEAQGLLSDEDVCRAIS
jgi:predicted transcriptional regulator